ncbi:hypothetical protein [Streptomyces sp. NPDC058653]|uniref:hypothetical protein n=1 Tax=Streptomyces sp. NPDC058653 TaxID=3346576 RepID=UPI0036648262
MTLGMRGRADKGLGVRGPSALFGDDDPVVAQQAGGCGEASVAGGPDLDPGALIEGREATGHRRDARTDLGDAQVGPEPGGALRVVAYPVKVSACSRARESEVHEVAGARSRMPIEVVRAGGADPCEAVDTQRRGSTPAGALAVLLHPDWVHSQSSNITRVAAVTASPGTPLSAQNFIQLAQSWA